MTRIFTRARWIAVGLVLAFVTVLYAQEAQVFQRGIAIVRGNIALGGITGNQIQMEGTTGDDYETYIAVADPTADRVWTVPDSASDSFVGLAATQTLTNKTLTQPVHRELSEIVTAANVLTSADCGATFYLNASAGFLTTLPSPTSLAGCYFKLVVHTATSTNGYTIGTPTADIIDGMVVGRDGAAGVACSNEDLITLVNGQMVGADWIELRTDGTNWYVHGMVDIAAGFTCTVT